MQSNLVKSEEQETLQKLIAYHSIDIWIGIVGLPINLLLLSIFFSKRAFFRQNMILIVLAFGDLSACLGILFLGLSRRGLYSGILQNNVVPVETPWTCALKPFVWFRLLGSVLQSAAVFWIGVERLLAVFCPIFYRDNLSKRKSRPCIFVLLYASTISLIAFFLAFSRRHQTAVYYCGRKAAFTNEFSTYIYVTAIGGYVGGLILNFATFITLCKLHSHRANIKETNRQLRILRYVVLISLISTLCITIPNIFSLFTALYGRMNITISESGSLLLGFKSFINLFIYLALKTDFRNRLMEMLGMQRNESIQASNEDSPRFKKQLSVKNNQDSAATELLTDNGKDGLIVDHSIN